MGSIKGGPLEGKRKQKNSYMLIIVVLEVSGDVVWRAEKRRY